MSKDSQELKQIIDTKLAIINRCETQKTRDKAMLEKRMSDLLAPLAKQALRVNADNAAHQKTIKRELKAIEKLCKENMNTLIQASKIMKLPSGTISFKMTPPKVRIINEDKTLRTLKAMSLQSLIRTTEEPNKRAIIDGATSGEPELKDKIKSIKSISISKKKELSIKPSASEKPTVIVLKRLKVLK